MAGEIHRNDDEAEVRMNHLAVTTVDLARLQFATTSLYHFLSSR
jgi:hypothetical protein